MSVASVCKRGHLLDLLTGARLPRSYCPECGTAVIRECEACNSPIPGVDTAEVDALGNYDGPEWARPNFCRSCGTAFPWVDRQGRIWELENLLRHETVPEKTKLIVREELEALMASDLSEKEEVRRWKRIRESAPGLWDRGGNLIQDLVTDYAKRKLGL